MRRRGVQRWVFRFLFGVCEAPPRAGMFCASWSVHPGPHLFSNRVRKPSSSGSDS